MPSNAVALTAVALGLVITGAAFGTGIQGFSRSSTSPQEQPTPQSTVRPEQPVSASQLLPEQQATRYQPLVATKLTLGVVIFNPSKDGAYLRSYPSLTQSAIEGVLPNGTKVRLGEKVGDFVAIATEAGVKGWVHQTMLATVR